MCALATVRGRASPPPLGLPSPINHQVLSDVLIITAAACPSSLPLCHPGAAQANPSLTQALKQPPLRVPCLRFQVEPRPPMPLSSPPFCGHNCDPSTTQLGSCDTPCLGPSTDFVLSLVFYAFLGLVSALGLGLPVPPSLSRTSN